MDFPYVFFFRIFASIACVIICIVEQKSLGEVIPYVLQWDSMGKQKTSPDCRNVPWQDTPSTEASGIQEERKSGEKCQEIHQLLWMEQVVAAWVGKVDKWMADVLAAWVVVWGPWVVHVVDVIWDVHAVAWVVLVVVWWCLWWCSWACFFRSAGSRKKRKKKRVEVMMILFFKQGKRVFPCQIHFLLSYKPQTMKQKASLEASGNGWTWKRVEGWWFLLWSLVFLLQLLELEMKIVQH